MKVHMLFMKIENWFLYFNFFKIGIFLIKKTQGKGLEILTPKQIHQKLTIALAQVKSGNTSGN